MSEYKQIDEDMPIAKRPPFCPLAACECLGKECAWFDKETHTCGSQAILKALKTITKKEVSNVPKES